MMRKSVLGLVVLVLGWGSGAKATSVNPLDDGGWVLVAHISNQGGMFDGNGNLDSNYSYGTYVSNPGYTTPDFQRVFPIVADRILFITGDRSIWAITDYELLRTLIDAHGNDQTPNIAFEIGVDGVISNVQGNVLSRCCGSPEDPWITMEGNHENGQSNQRIVWGENDFSGFEHSTLKNTHGGMQVFVQPIPEPSFIDFDGFPGMTPNVPGTTVPAASRLSDQFLTTLGVSFRSGSTYVAVVDHSAPGTETVSPPNVIGGVLPNGALSYGTAISIAFFDPSDPTTKGTTDFVSIRGELNPLTGASATMEAFDVFGQPLGSVTDIDSSLGLTLSLSTIGIHSILLTQNSASGPVDGTIGFDNLQFNSIVPESDQDGDGLLDVFETNTGVYVDPTDTGTDPLNPDTDADGAIDGADAFPLDPTETLDTDGDGTGNNADADDDGDGLTDTFEDSIGTNPLLVDTDFDTLFDGVELAGGTDPLLADTDGDNTNDAMDNCPLTPNENQSDWDEDGLGNVCDPDPAPEPGELPLLLSGILLLSMMMARRRRVA